MSKQNSTDDLIASLAEDLEPVKPIANPLYCIVPWIVLTILYTAFIVYSLGLRFDVHEKLQSPEFLFEMINVFVMGAVAAWCSVLLRYPDVRGTKWLLSVPVTLCLSLAVWHLCIVYSKGFQVPNLTLHHCVKDAGLIGGFPILIMLIVVRRGKTTFPRWMAFMNVLAVGAVGWIGLRLSCMSDDIGHTFLYHFFPFVIGGLLISALAKRLYSW
jgi:hypothetical protein